MSSQTSQESATSSSQTTTFSSVFYLALIFISIVISSLLTLVGPFGFGQVYYGTQIIPHPSEGVISSLRNTSYAVVFDGGSTGTRVHIFFFSSQVERKTRRIFLEKEIFHHISPGLSYYSHNSTEAAESLEPLLKKALSTVPDHKALETNIILKATAGLRLLPEEVAESILKSVMKKFKSTPYKGLHRLVKKNLHLNRDIVSVSENAVSMLDDRDEGLFAWYTVNFLLSKLHCISTSIATLDLGGGSTQVTFATNNTETLVRSPNGFIAKRDIEGEPEYIYTHSYLGFGLMSSRKKILLRSNLTEVEDLTEGTIVRTRSPCFATLGNKTQNWKFEDINYEITGDLSVNPFEKCYELAKSLVSNGIHKSNELKNREIYGLSYYFDRMKDVRIIKGTIGVIKVRDYYSIAENICKSGIKLKNQSPFLCLDLTYITAFLHHGLGLDWGKDITLVKKINGIETSWALGAAINLLNLDDNNQRNDQNLESV